MNIQSHITTCDRHNKHFSWSIKKMGAIPSSLEWQNFQKIRNQFAHEYPDDPDLNAALLNQAYEQGKILQHAFLHVKKFVKINLSDKP